MHTEQHEDLRLDKKIIIWDNSGRSKIVIAVFIFYILFTSAFLVFNHFQLEILRSALSGVVFTEEEATAFETKTIIFTVAFLICYVITVVVFLNWFRRAYGNLHRVGLEKMEHEESMAAWAWFIPVIFIFRPVQITSEIWAKTQNVIKSYNSNYSIRNGSLLIGFWWALFIFSQIMGQVSFRLSLKEETLEEILRGYEISLWTDALSIPEAILLILVVYYTSRLEATMAQEVIANGGQVIKP